MVVISGEVNDNILQTSTCNLQPSLCIGFHHVKHVKMLWVQTCAGRGGVMGVVGSNWGCKLGLQIWVVNWGCKLGVQIKFKLNSN